MHNLFHYINEVLGTDLDSEPVPSNYLDSLPLYIRESYRFYFVRLYNHSFVLAEIRKEDSFSNLQIEKHLGIIRSALNKKVALVSEGMSAINRKRFIEKGIDFVVPGKQLFLPDMLIDLKETFSDSRMNKKKDKLLPSSQYILLYHILHRYNEIQIKDLSFKELAERMGYTQMAISKAVENLKYYDLCKVEGLKEKYIHFNLERS